MEKELFTKVDGKFSGNIYLFALSTCIWCKRTKNLLDTKGVQYNYVFVDKLKEKERQLVRETLKQYNEKMSYPTIIYNDDKCIVGFDEDEINAVIA